MIVLCPNCYFPIIPAHGARQGTSTVICRCLATVSIKVEIVEPSPKSEEELNRNQHRG